MKRRDLIRAGAVAALAEFAAAAPFGSALGQQKMVWKATDVHPLGYPTVEAIEKKLHGEALLGSRVLCLHGGLG